MTQKRKKSVSSNRHGNSANTEAPQIQGQLKKKKKKKKSIVNRKKNLSFNQIIISNREEVTQKLNLFDQISNGEEDTQMEVDQVMGIHFREEIMTEIFNRLPVRSLLRFKCVSKIWKALIVDPYFKMKHHIHTKHEQNSQKFLVTQICTHNKDDVFNFYCSSLSSVQVVQDEQKLDFPSSCKPDFSKICCSCDGLVLLVVCSDSLDKHLLLWNPSTRESIFLPHPKFPLLYYVYGLGYDATSDDYKILAVNLNAGDGHYISNNISIEILALKSGSWRSIGYPTDIQRVKGFRDCGTNYLAFVHGAFHWLSKWSISGYYTIVSFNISNEVCEKIPLLQQMFNRYSTYLFIDHGVSVLDGMLCFYRTCNDMSEPEHRGTFKLWVMKEYGVKESWTQLITIQDTNLFFSARPKYMFADGEVLLVCKRIGNVSSALISSREPYGLWPEIYTIMEGIAYTESLISPELLIT